MNMLKTYYFNNYKYSMQYIHTRLSRRGKIIFYQVRDPINGYSRLKLKIKVNGYLLVKWKTEP